MTKQNYIKSPLNFTGSKYKLLSQILPLFPDNIDTFVDLFGGGFNVGVNVKAKHIVYNDMSIQLAKMLRYIQSNDIETLIGEIVYYIEKYHLTKTNKDGYLALREDYNSGVRSSMKLYTLLCYAFNNQIRFNKNGEYNMPFGKNRSWFNPVLKQKFIDFHERIVKLDCSFLSIPFDRFDFSELSSSDFVYCDPPYYNSVATYNEQKGWTEKDEEKLLAVLDNLNENGIRFALSNNLKYDNPLLHEWKDKYNVHYLDMDYSNCSYQKKDKSKDIEVLITNY